MIIQCSEESEANDSECLLNYVWIFGLCTSTGQFASSPSGMTDLCTFWSTCKYMQIYVYMVPVGTGYPTPWYDPPGRAQPPPATTPMEVASHLAPSVKILYAMLACWPRATYAPHILHNRDTSMQCSLLPIICPYNLFTTYSWPLSTLK